MHFSNIEAYTCYMLDTLQSWITAPLTCFFPKKFPIPLQPCSYKEPHSHWLLNFSEKQLKTMYATWFEVFLLECVYSISFEHHGQHETFQCHFVNIKSCIIWQKHCCNLCVCAFKWKLFIVPFCYGTHGILCKTFG